MRLVVSFGVLIGAFIAILFVTVKKSVVIDIPFIRSVLLKAGFKPTTVNLFIAQVLFETGAKFEQLHETDGCNLSGIRYINKSYQKNAVKGNPMPKADDPNGFYAKFASYVDWAIDYKRILNLNMGMGKPIDSTTPEELVLRLKQNFYFGGNQQNYLAGVKKYLETLTN